MTVITAVSAGAMHVPSATGLTTGADPLLLAAAGYELGFRTVVLQGGEDPYFYRLETNCGWCLPSSGHTRTVQ